MFAIGDVHGCARTFRKLITEEINIHKTDHIYCIGDYVDRGPDSKGVIDFILELRHSGYNIITLRGNHEQMMLDANNSRNDLQNWFFNGGQQTLDSLGIDTVEDLAPQYRTFLESTEFYREWEQYILVHAGLNFQIANPLQDKHAMLWIRDFVVDRKWLDQRIIVHGHTPMPEEALLSQELNSAIDIDAGCVYNMRPGMGHLCAFDLLEKEFLCIPNIDL